MHTYTRPVSHGPPNTSSVDPVDPCSACHYACCVPTAQLTLARRARVVFVASKIPQAQPPPIPPAGAGRVSAS